MKEKPARNFTQKKNDLPYKTYKMQKTDRTKQSGLLFYGRGYDKLRNKNPTKGMRCLADQDSERIACVPYADG